jgi:NADPH2:quinone reductase
MTKAIRFYETGGPEVLKFEDVEVGEPSPGQARVRHTYIALNFIDVYFRTGRYPWLCPTAWAPTRWAWSRPWGRVWTM